MKRVRRRGRPKYVFELCKIVYRDRGLLEGFRKRSIFRHAQRNPTINAFSARDKDSCVTGRSGAGASFIFNFAKAVVRALFTACKKSRHEKSGKIAKGELRAWGCSGQWGDIATRVRSQAGETERARSFVCTFARIWPEGKDYRWPRWISRVRNPR